MFTKYLLGLVLDAGQTWSLASGRLPNNSGRDMVEPNPGSFGGHRAPYIPSVVNTRLKGMVPAGSVSLCDGGNYSTGHKNRKDLRSKHSGYKQF